MICFRVTRNGERRCIAGLPEGVVSAGMMWASHADGSGRYGLEFYVTGVYGGDEGVTSVEWSREPLAVGDSVTIEVVEAAEADAYTLVPPLADDEVAAIEMVKARRQHGELRRRLAALEEKWGPWVAEG